MKRTTTTVWLAAIGLLLPLTSRARAQDSDHDHHHEDAMSRTISVSGTGTLSAAPDVADINIGVVTQGGTAQEALSSNTEAMTQIHDLLKGRGVAAKDVQTTNINVQPQYNQQPNQPRQGSEPFVPKIVSYQVTNTVQITARELDKLGAVLDAVVQAGANQINGISFRVEKPEPLLDQCRKQAMADARRKAEMLVGEAGGVVLGAPMSINGSGGGMPPQPMYMARTMSMAASPVPVAAGEQELSVSVSVVYELKIAE